MTLIQSVIFVVSAMGLYVFAEWILSFVQEIAGVSTDPQGSWSTMHILFLSFLVCKAKAGRPDPQGSWSTMQILFLSFVVCELKVDPSLKWRQKKMFLPWDCLPVLNGS